jgi:hypothetical protein
MTRTASGAPPFDLTILTKFAASDGSFNRRIFDHGVCRSESRSC